MEVNGDDKTVNEQTLKRNGAAVIPGIADSSEQAGADTSDEDTASPTVQDHNAVVNGKSETGEQKLSVVDVDDGSQEGDSEEEEDEEGSSEEDDEDDEEYEPALKYDLLGGETSKLLERDSASALAVSSKYIVRLSQTLCRVHFYIFRSQVMGTHNGIIHVLSHQGERVKSYRPHTASVMDLCIDTTFDFIGSASLDGKLLVYTSAYPG